MLAFGKYHHPSVRVLNLSGRLDAHFKLGLEALIAEAETNQCRHVILNFSDITWIDLGGLGQVFVWYHNLKANQVRLSIVSPQPMVRQLLESANLPEIIPIYQSVPEAMRGFPAASFSAG